MVFLLHQALFTSRSKLLSPLSDCTIAFLASTSRLLVFGDYIGNATMSRMIVPGTVYAVIAVGVSGALALIQHHSSPLNLRVGSRCC